MRILVTGASGYIGERLVALTHRAGHEVVAATRTRPADPRLPWVAFDFATVQSFRMPTGIDAVIHLAAVTTASDISPETEIAAAAHLAESARHAGIRLLFISSQVARRDAPTPYGQIKWAIEQLVAASGGVSIRPGQVYGGCERGLFGLLVRLVRSLPVIPAFLPAPRIQPIHVDDLAHGILASLETAVASGRVLCLGSPEPVTFTHFLSVIARQRLRTTRVRVPVPSVLVLLGVTLLGKRLAERLGLDKLKSLFEVPTMDSRKDLSTLGLTLRPLASGMVHSGNDRRRRLAAEGVALLTYMLRQRPGLSLTSRYVRVIEALRGGEPLGLPALIMRFPATLAMADTPATRGPKADETGWRLGAAMTIAEATPQGALRFLGKAGSLSARPLAATLTIGRAIAMSALWRLARPFAAPFLRPQFNLRRSDHHENGR